jgi:hypothetical protein
VTGYSESKKKNEPNQARFSGRGGGVQFASGRGFALGLKMLVSCNKVLRNILFSGLKVVFELLISISCVAGGR